MPAMVTPAECVCSMGTATIQEGFDMLLTDIGPDYVVERRPTRARRLVIDARCPTGQG